MLKKPKFWPKVAQNRQNHANYADFASSTLPKYGRGMTKIEIKYFSCRNSKIFEKYFVNLGFF